MGIIFAQRYRAGTREDRVNLRCPHCQKICLKDFVGVQVSYRCANCKIRVLIEVEHKNLTAVPVS